MPTPINYKALKPSEGSISPAVITSKTAQRDLFNIQQQHADVVMGISNQKARVDTLNQQKQAELQAQQSMKSEMDMQKQVANTTAQKNAMDFATQQGELDVKRAALSQKI